ncbi:MAG: FAD-dependent oxidoreductase, partial [Lachnospiraceae bacterium]|nr:FAD-dependent oxidoreductase [Lachnospiraceae bacterium]
MRIIEHGGEVRFNSCVKDLVIENSAVCGVKLEDGSTIETNHVILAVGHSARELFKTLNEQQITMEPKAFAVGLRVQHPQSMMNLSQYGREDAGDLGAAPYKVTAKTSCGRGVYSFCMCPGGYVVNASSEEGRLAVNGMSYYKRGGKNANSAIIVSVTPEDFPEAGPLGGIEFQRRLEEKAFELGNGKIPVQLYEDFADNRESEAFGDVTPQICGEFTFANLRNLMTEEMNQAFIEGMTEFGRKIRGFDRADAILAGIESRTSSPLRIVRDENMESNVKGLYPCGEGAGYAGGITSAAMDGLKVAEALIKRYNVF